MMSLARLFIFASWFWVAPQFAEARPDWLRKTPMDTATHRYYVGRASKVDSEAKAYRIATRDAQEAAIRANFGVLTSIESASYSGMHGASSMDVANEISSHVVIKGFELIESHIDEDDGKVSLWLLFKYSRAAITVEQQRLAEQKKDWPQLKKEHQLKEYTYQLAQQNEARALANQQKRQQLQKQQQQADEQQSPATEQELVILSAAKDPTPWWHTTWIWGLYFGLSEPTADIPQAQSLLQVGLSIERRVWGFFGARVNCSYDMGMDYLGDEGRTTVTDKKLYEVTGLSYSVGLPLYLGRDISGFYLMPEVGRLKHTYFYEDSSNYDQGDEFQLNQERKALTLGYQALDSQWKLDFTVSMYKVTDINGAQEHQTFSSNIGFVFGSE